MTDQRHRERVLAELLSCGLIEIRALCREGRTKQAEALADAMHNIPAFLMDPAAWDVEQFAVEFAGYQSRYAGKRRGSCRYDYVHYLSAIEKSRSPRAKSRKR